jgi:hypothetical protein
MERKRNRRKKSRISNNKKGISINKFNHGKYHGSNVSHLNAQK